MTVSTMNSHQEQIRISANSVFRLKCLFVVAHSMQIRIAIYLNGNVHVRHGGTSSANYMQI